jgi:hypothetical protein
MCSVLISMLFPLYASQYDSQNMLHILYVIASSCLILVTFSRCLCATSSFDSIRSRAEGAVIGCSRTRQLIFPPPSSADNSTCPAAIKFTRYMQPCGDPLANYLMSEYWITKPTRTFLILAAPALTYTKADAVGAITLPFLRP